MLLQIEFTKPTRPVDSPNDQTQANKTNTQHKHTRTTTTQHKWENFFNEKKHYTQDDRVQMSN